MGDISIYKKLKNIQYTDVILKDRHLQFHMIYNHKHYTVQVYLFDNEGSPSIRHTTEVSIKNNDIYVLKSRESISGIIEKSNHVYIGKERTDYVVFPVTFPEESNVEAQLFEVQLVLNQSTNIESMTMNFNNVKKYKNWKVVRKNTIMSDNTLNKNKINTLFNIAPRSNLIKSVSIRPNSEYTISNIVNKVPKIALQHSFTALKPPVDNLFENVSNLFQENTSTNTSTKFSYSMFRVLKYGKAKEGDNLQIPACVKIPMLPSAAGSYETIPYNAKSLAIEHATSCGVKNIPAFFNVVWNQKTDIPVPEDKQKLVYAYVLMPIMYQDSDFSQINSTNRSIHELYKQVTKNKLNNKQLMENSNPVVTKLYKTMTTDLKSIFENQRVNDKLDLQRLIKVSLKWKTFWIYICKNIIIQRAEIVNKAHLAGLYNTFELLKTCSNEKYKKILKIIFKNHINYFKQIPTLQSINLSLNLNGKIDGKIDSIMKSIIQSLGYNHYIIDNIKKSTGEFEHQEIIVKRPSKSFKIPVLFEYIIPCFYYDNIIVETVPTARNQQVESSVHDKICKTILNKLKRYPYTETKYKANLFSVLPKMYFVSRTPFLLYISTHSEIIVDENHTLRFTRYTADVDMKHVISSVFNTDKSKFMLYKTLLPGLRKENIMNNRNEIDNQKVQKVETNQGIPMTYALYCRYAKLPRAPMQTVQKPQVNTLILPGRTSKQQTDTYFNNIGLINLSYERGSYQITENTCVSLPGLKYSLTLHNAISLYKKILNTKGVINTEAFNNLWYRYAATPMAPAYLYDAFFTCVNKWQNLKSKDEEIDIDINILKELKDLQNNKENIQVVISYIRICWSQIIVYSVTTLINSISSYSASSQSPIRYTDYLSMILADMQITQRRDTTMRDNIISILTLLIRESHKRSGLFHTVKTKKNEFMESIESMKTLAKKINPVQHNQNHVITSSVSQHVQNDRDNNDNRPQASRVKAKQASWYKNEIIKFYKSCILAYKAILYFRSLLSPNTPSHLRSEIERIILELKNMEPTYSSRPILKSLLQLEFKQEAGNREITQDEIRKVLHRMKLVIEPVQRNENNLSIPDILHKLVINNDNEVYPKSFIKIFKMPPLFILTESLVTISQSRVGYKEIRAMDLTKTVHEYFELHNTRKLKSFRKMIEDSSSKALNIDSLNKKNRIKNYSLSAINSIVSEAILELGNYTQKNNKDNTNTKIRNLHNSIKSILSNTSLPSYRIKRLLAFLKTDQTNSDQDELKNNLKNILLKKLKQQKELAFLNSIIRGTKIGEKLHAFASLRLVYVKFESNPKSLSDLENKILEVWHNIKHNTTGDPNTKVALLMQLFKRSKGDRSQETNGQYATFNAVSQLQATKFYVNLLPPFIYMSIIYLLYIIIKNGSSSEDGVVRAQYITLNDITDKVEELVQKEYNIDKIPGNDRKELCYQIFGLRVLSKREKHEIVFPYFDEVFKIDEAPVMNTLFRRWKKQTWELQSSNNGNNYTFQTMLSLEEASFDTNIVDYWSDERRNDVLYIKGELLCAKKLTQGPCGPYVLMPSSNSSEPHTLQGPYVDIFCRNQVITKGINISRMKSQKGISHGLNSIYSLKELFNSKNVLSNLIQVDSSKSDMIFNGLVGDGKQMNFFPELPRSIYLGNHIKNTPYDTMCKKLELMCIIIKLLLHCKSKIANDTRNMRVNQICATLSKVIPMSIEGILSPDNKKEKRNGIVIPTQYAFTIRKDLIRNGVLKDDVIHFTDWLRHKIGGINVPALYINKGRSCKNKCLHYLKDVKIIKTQEINSKLRYSQHGVNFYKFGHLVIHDVDIKNIKAAFYFTYKKGTNSHKLDSRVKNLISNITIGFQDTKNDIRYIQFGIDKNKSLKIYLNVQNTNTTKKIPKKVMFGKTLLDSTKIIQIPSELERIESRLSKYAVLFDNDVDLSNPGVFSEKNEKFEIRTGIDASSFVLAFMGTNYTLSKLGNIDIRLGNYTVTNIVGMPKGEYTKVKARSNDGHEIEFINPLTSGAVDHVKVNFKKFILQNNDTFEVHMGEGAMPMYITLDNIDKSFNIPSPEQTNNLPLDTGRYTVLSMDDNGIATIRKENDNQEFSIKNLINIIPITQIVSTGMLSKWRKMTNKEIASKTETYKKLLQKKEELYTKNNHQNNEQIKKIHQQIAQFEKFRNIVHIDNNYSTVAKKLLTGDFNITAHDLNNEPSLSGKSLTIDDYIMIQYNTTKFAKDNKVLHLNFKNNSITIDNKTLNLSDVIISSELYNIIQELKKSNDKKNDFHVIGDEMIRYGTSLEATHTRLYMSKNISNKTFNSTFYIDIPVKLLPEHTRLEVAYHYFKPAYSSFFDKPLKKISEKSRFTTFDENRLNIRKNITYTNTKNYFNQALKKGRPQTIIEKIAKHELHKNVIRNNVNMGMQYLARVSQNGKSYIIGLHNIVLEKNKISENHNNNSKTPQEDKVESRFHQRLTDDSLMLYIKEMDRFFDAANQHIPGRKHVHLDKRIANSIPYMIDVNKKSILDNDSHLQSLAYDILVDQKIAIPLIGDTKKPVHTIISRAIAAFAVYSTKISLNDIKPDKLETDISVLRAHAMDIDGITADTLPSSRRELENIIRALENTHQYVTKRYGRKTHRSVKHYYIPPNVIAQYNRLTGETHNTNQYKFDKKHRTYRPGYFDVISMLVFQREPDRQDSSSIVHHIVNTIYSYAVTHEIRNLFRCTTESKYKSDVKIENNVKIKNDVKVEADKYATIANIITGIKNSDVKLYSYDTYSGEGSKIVHPFEKISEINWNLNGLQIMQSEKYFQNKQILYIIYPTVHTDLNHSHGHSRHVIKLMKQLGVKSLTTVDALKKAYKKRRKDVFLRLVHLLQNDAGPVIIPVYRKSNSDLNLISYKLYDINIQSNKANEFKISINSIKNTVIDLIVPEFKYTRNVNFSDKKYQDSSLLPTPKFPKDNIKPLLKQLGLVRELPATKRYYRPSQYDVDDFDHKISTAIHEISTGEISIDIGQLLIQSKVAQYMINLIIKASNKKPAAYDNISNILNSNQNKSIISKLMTILKTVRYSKINPRNRTLNITPVGRLMHILNKNYDNIQKYELIEAIYNAYLHVRMRESTPYTESKYVLIHTDIFRKFVPASNYKYTILGHNRTIKVNTHENDRIQVSGNLSNNRNNSTSNNSNNRIIKQKGNAHNNNNQSMSIENYGKNRNDFKIKTKKIPIIKKQEEIPFAPFIDKLIWHDLMHILTIVCNTIRPLEMSRLIDVNTLHTKTNEKRVMSDKITALLTKIKEYSHITPVCVVLKLSNIIRKVSPLGSTDDKVLKYITETYGNQYAQYVLSTDPHGIQQINRNMERMYTKSKFEKLLRTPANSQPLSDIVAKSLLKNAASDVDLKDGIYRLPPITWVWFTSKKKSTLTQSSTQDTNIMTKIMSKLKKYYTPINDAKDKRIAVSTLPINQMAITKFFHNKYIEYKDTNNTTYYIYPIYRYYKYTRGRNDTKSKSNAFKRSCTNLMQKCILKAINYNDISTLIENCVKDETLYFKNVEYKNIITRFVKDLYLKNIVTVLNATNYSHLKGTAGILSKFNKNISWTSSDKVVIESTKKDTFGIRFINLQKTKSTNAMQTYLFGSTSLELERLALSDILLEIINNNVVSEISKIKPKTDGSKKLKSVKINDITNFQGFKDLFTEILKHSDDNKSKKIIEKRLHLLNIFIKKHGIELKNNVCVNVGDYETCKSVVYAMYTMFIINVKKIKQEASIKKYLNPKKGSYCKNKTYKDKTLTIPHNSSRKLHNFMTQMTKNNKFLMNNSNRKQIDEAIAILGFSQENATALTKQNSIDTLKTRYLQINEIIDALNIFTKRINSKVKNNDSNNSNSNPNALNIFTKRINSKVKNNDSNNSRSNEAPQNNSHNNSNNSRTTPQLKIKNGKLSNSENKSINDLNKISYPSLSNKSDNQISP